jgi:hypothetical protein
MTKHDYDNGYRAGMQKMRDLTRGGHDLEEALFDMVGLFSADNMLLKGTHLPSALYAARAALQTRRTEYWAALKGSTMTKLEELKAACDAVEAAEAACDAARDTPTSVAARADAWAAHGAAWNAYQAELKKINGEL